MCRFLSNLCIRACILEHSLNFEIGQNFHKLNRKGKFQEEPTISTMVGGDVPRRTLRDYITSGAHSQTPNITRPLMIANNFGLKPSLISMVQQSQFGGGGPKFVPLGFLKVCDTLKINGASTNAIHLRLFLVSLKDSIRAWLYSLPSGSISAWDELTKFFPLSKTMGLRNQSTSFA